MKLNEQAIETIETWRLGFIATVAENGTPNLSPKGTFIILDEETIAFGEMRSPNTVANISHQAEVEVNFVDILTRKGIRIRGNAKRHDAHSQLFQTTLPQFKAIWGDELCALMNEVVTISTDQIKPLQSPVYELDGNAEELKALWQSKIAAM